MSEFPKPDVASGGIRLDGDRMQALVVGLASGRRDKTTQGTCSPSCPGTDPMRHDSGPRPGTGPPRAMGTGLPAGPSPRPRIRALGRDTSVDVCSRLQGRGPAFRRPVRCPRITHSPLECDGLGMTSHAWCTGHVAGFANLHSNGRVLPFGVGTVGNSIGSANLCGLDLFHVRSGQSWWPSYKMDLGLLPFCERPNAH